MLALVCDLPYPEIENLQKDARSGQLLRFAYASPNGQLAMLLQYNLQIAQCEKLDGKMRQTLQQLALAKQRHVALIGQAMVQLGVAPNYTFSKNKTQFSTESISVANTPRKMIFDDVVGETDALATYKKITFALKNDDVRAFVERLILDQQLQIDTLKKILKNL